MGHRWGKITTEAAMKAKYKLLVAKEEKEENLRKTTVKAWAKERTLKAALGFKVAPMTLFTELAEFDERHPEREVFKAEDILVRAMEMGKADELSLALEIASRHGVNEETIAGARLMSERLTNLYLGFDGPGAYRNKLAQAEHDETARDQMRAEHAAAVKTFREREVACVAQERALAAERALLEGELSARKAQLAEEIVDVVAHKATLEASFVAECKDRKKEVEDAWLGLDDERRRRFEADMRRRDEDAAMVGRRGGIGGFELWA